MMRHWPTWLLALILTGLGAYLYYIEFPAQLADDQAKVQQGKLLPFEEREITGLTLRSNEQEIVLVPGNGRDWLMKAPVKTDADSREVQSLIRALVTGKVTRVVEDQATALAPFGLEKPSARITVVGDAKNETFAIGDIGPLSSTLYVLRESDHKVLLTDLAPKDVLNKTVMTFRRKDILRVEQKNIERIRLTYPTMEIVLYGEEGKGQRRWKIRYPLEALADQAEVRALLFRLEDLKAMGIIDPGPEWDATMKRLTVPTVKVTIHAGGTDEVVKLYQPSPSSGEAFAETKPGGPIYRINPTAIKDLTKEVFALQDKRLLGIEIDEIALLSVKTRDDQYVLVHDNNEWVLEDQPTEKLNQEVAALFVSRVAGLPAEERVIKQSAPLAPYGLVAPAAEFTATGRDGKIGGKLALGNQVGGLVYATGQRLRGLYQARADILSQIPSKQDLLAKSTEMSTLSTQ